MRGAISIASNPEGVTELIIRLPLAERQGRQEAQPAYSSEMA